MDELRAPGVSLGEKRVEPLGAAFREQVLVGAASASADLASRKVHLVDDGIEVEPRATAQDRSAPLCKEAVRAGACVSLKALDGVTLGRVTDVNHQKRAVPLPRRGLCGAHVHAAIDLHGVDGDDGALEAQGHGLGKRALARGRGADDAHDLGGLAHRGSPSTSPRRYQVLASRTRTSTIFPMRSIALSPTGRQKWTVWFFSL